ncbi:MAG: alcohol dehydrogenase catalytic domain-containing protein, partial [Candidatus Poseidoniia archaeon]|nr:alcohol dehydrogenase catalytic domain-containing protein [Candidatus Poseidoniia archaeon]
MKAVWYESIGEAEQVLNYGDLEDPQINDGEVLVKLKTSGVNPSDVKIRAGARGELQFPRIIPHSDGGGIIVKVGEEVSEDRIGERVWIWNGAFGRAFGTCSELIVLPSSQAVTMPDDVSFETAACLGIPASTAYYGIFADGPVKDQTILITGG